MNEKDSLTTPSLTRARIGAALRAQRSPLNPRGDSQASVAAGLEAERLAAQLSAVAPGLALMLQLRARAFDDAAAAALDRGVRLIVSIGSGFDDRRAGACADPSRWEVDHRAILAAKGARSMVEQVVVDDLDSDAWSELHARGVPLARERTLFVVHNPTLWSSRPPLESFLPRFAVAATAGSEILLNLPDDENATGGALRVVAPVSAPGGSKALLELHRRCAAHGLEIAAAWGTGDLQRCYLGSSDLLVREFFVWIWKNEAPSGSARAVSMHDLLGHSPVSVGGAGGLTATTALAAAAGLTSMRQGRAAIRIERAPVQVVARPAREAWAHGVAAEACILLRRIAELLDQSRVPLLLLDISSTDVRRPEAHGRGGAPAVVRISEPQYSRQIVAPELTHVIARSASAWLSEGLAVWTQRRIAPGSCFPDDVQSGAVDEAVTRPRGLSLGEWLQRPVDLPMALRPVARRPGRSEYRRAASFVDFFMRSRGRRAFFQLFALSGQPGFLEAVAGVCRSVGWSSLDEMEAEWEASLRQRSG